MLYQQLIPAITGKFLPIIQAIIGFGSVIAIHECGHFFFCKIFGVDTPTFSIGMGPTIFKKKFGQTNFRLAALPIGGSLEIRGAESPHEQDAPTADSGAFHSKSYWQKVLIMLGGIIFNLLFAYITFSSIYWYGMPTSNVGKLSKIHISDVLPESIAELSGLKARDVIIGLNDRTFAKKTTNLKTFIDSISGKTNTSLSLLIERSGEIMIKKVNFNRTSKRKDGGIFGIVYTPDGQYERIPGKPLGFFEAFSKGAKQTAAQLVGIAGVIKSMITKKSVRGVGGPLMILTHSFYSAKDGIIPLLLFLAFISVNLALLNLLPFGIVDGGKVLFLTIEAVIGRSVPEIIQITINGFSFLAIMALMLFLTYRDIVGMWFK